jgi:hypothetical protein
MNFGVCLRPGREQGQPAGQTGLETHYPAQVLQMTEKYCLDRGIPFPRIELGPEDLKEPRECYLFTKADDPYSPIVLHFPLVNRTFRTQLAPGKGTFRPASDL